MVGRTSLYIVEMAYITQRLSIGRGIRRMRVTPQRDRITVSSNRTRSKRRRRRIMTVKAVDNYAVRFCRGSPGKVIVWRIQSGRSGIGLIPRALYRVNRSIGCSKLSIYINYTADHTGAEADRIGGAILAVRSKGEILGRRSARPGGSIHRTVRIMAFQAELLGQHVINIIRRVAGRGP